MKKVIAVSFFMLMLGVNSAYSFGWDDVSRYAGDTWDSITGYVTGWFTSEETSGTPQNSDALPENIAGKWDKLSKNLNDALELRDKQETLPDSSWLPFTEDKQSNSRKINEILDRALDILSGGDAGNTRSEAVRLRTKISSLRVELDDLRNKRITAPESTYLFWQMTKTKIDSRIKEVDKEIERTESDLRDINSKLTAELQNIGLELTESQTDILLNSVTGEDILQNTVIFDNVKAVVEKLEELSQNDSNTLEITKRYTGMYLVLNDLLIHTQEELIRKMDGEYKPRLREIMTEAESLRRDAEAKSKNKSYTPEQRNSFSQNAKSNSVTVQAAKLYGELLDSQRGALMSSLRSLRLNRDLAENTYRTVRSSGELRGLIHSGLNVFDAIGKLSMPELKIFESGIMRAEFDEINRRLKR
ncbi:MAG: hypothetical protein IJ697_06310 [Synergistaceae bacterium]|nr:hypothetical protein [Synergistaceae bacterium]